MDAKFAGFVCAPDFVAVMFAYNLSFGLKIRVNWQKIHHFLVGEAGILAFCCLLAKKVLSTYVVYSLVCMSHYYMPEGMRPSTLEERKEFYTNDFAVGKVSDWLAERQGKTKFAVIIGRHTKIYPEEYADDAETTIIIDDYVDLADVRNQVLEFVPESVYYDRTCYDKDDAVVGQELAFDLDPENITCPVHGTLADKMARGQGLGFCEIELGLVKEQAVSLYEHLAEQFSRLRIVYSGRGFHIHVLDPDAYSLSTKARLELAEKVKSLGFEIDAWVTAGEMRLIRLPFSLHGMVSRVAIPLEKNEIEKFNPIQDARCIPAFLKQEFTSS